jgi:hypothetical protein
VGDCEVLTQAEALGVRVAPACVELLARGADEQAGAAGGVAPSGLSGEGGRWDRLLTS